MIFPEWLRLSSKKNLKYDLEKKVHTVDWVYLSKNLDDNLPILQKCLDKRKWTLHDYNFYSKVIFIVMIASERYSYNIRNIRKIIRK